MKYGILKMLIDNEAISLNFCREVACFLTPNQGLITLSTNNMSGGVELDFFKIWDVMRSGEKNPYCFIIHTHPPGCDGMSGTDKNMVYGWCQALGIPIYYTIITENVIRCWLCIRDKSNKSKIYRRFHFALDYSEDLSRVVDEYKAVQPSLVFWQLFAKMLYGMSKTQQEISEECELDFKRNIDDCIQFLFFDKISRVEDCEEIKETI